MKGFIFIAVIVLGVFVPAVFFLGNAINEAAEKAAVKENAYLDTQLNPKWEEIVIRRKNGNLVGSVGRTKTPTGWLIYSFENVTFVPDPEHTWLVDEVEKDN